MIRYKVTELVTGAVVLAIAGAFATYALFHTGHKKGGGYHLNASFDLANGLSAGSDVRIAGIGVGIVDSVRFDPQTNFAKIEFSVNNEFTLPVDTSAAIKSEGLLGGKYLELSTGRSQRLLAPGGTIFDTQGSLPIEALIGQYIFPTVDSGSIGTNQSNKPSSGAITPLK